MSAPDGDPVDDVLDFALGGENCNRSSGSQIISLFALPVVALLLLLLLFWPGNDRYWMRTVPNPNHRFMAKVLLFIAVLFIADRIIARYRTRNNTCS